MKAKKILLGIMAMALVFSGCNLNNTTKGGLIGGAGGGALGAGLGAASGALAVPAVLSWAQPSAQASVWQAAQQLVSSSARRWIRLRQLPRQ